MNLQTLTMAGIGFFLTTQAWALAFDADVPQDIQNQMLADLNFISSVQGSGQTPLHQQIFGPVSGESYKNFFESRIVRIGLDDCGGGMAVACVIPMLGSNKMFLSEAFTKFSHPQISRIMVAYHEARHSETNHQNWPHDICPTPFLDEQGHDIVGMWSGAKLEGVDGCDSTPLGSYGSSAILVKNIAKYCTNCSDKVKMDANIYATDQLNRITGKEAKQAMTEDFKK